MHLGRGAFLAGLTAVVSMVSACSREQAPTPDPTATASATASALTVYQSVGAVADGYISSSTANKAFGADSFLRVKASGNNRALVAFSATDLSNAIGSDTVTSATLELTISGSPASWGTGAPIGAYPVSQSWSETSATWNCAADANTSNSTADCSGADVWAASGNVPVPSGAASDTIVMTNGQSGTVSFDVTADVLAGVAGWLVAKTDGSSGTAEFGSRESGSGPRLLLEIETGPCVADAQCSDGDVCNGQEVCSAGACALGSALVCDDGEPKNGAESCDPVAGCLPGVPPPVLIAADTEIKSGSATKNFGTLTTVEIRAAATRTLLALDPAALSAAIGNGTVNGAHLELAISGSPGSWGTTGRPIGVYPVTQSFGETSATWSCSSDSNPANSTNDCAPADAWSGNGNVPNPVTAPTDTVLITNGLSGTVSFDVTADIAAGVSAFILANMTGESGTVDFASRESGNGPRVLLDLSFECVRDADCDDADGCNGIETCAENLCVPPPPESYDADGDGTADCDDGCPADAGKTQPGACGCGAADTDGDLDGTADCNDGCPSDPAKVAAGACGCGVSDVDTDADGTADCNDGCANDPAKAAAGICGCGVSDADGDGDGTVDCNDGCADDPAKSAPGICGCGVSDADGDLDGIADCADGCPSDATKVAAGVCGCGVSDADADADGAADCIDGCPSDAAKVAAGACGCRVADTDSDGDATPDCDDGCPSDAGKLAPGVCGCGVSDADGDADGTADCNDGCPSDPAKTAAGACGCGVVDADSDADGTPDCNDACPFDDGNDADQDGICGDVDVCWNGDDNLDQDADGFPDACDPCPADPANEDDDGDGICGTDDSCELGADGVDADGDGVCDAMDTCPGQDDNVDQDSDGTADCLLWDAGVATGAMDATSMAAIDLNGDGRSDLIVGTSSGALQQWLAAADGSFNLLQSQAVAPHPIHQLIVADANGDGHTDVIVGPHAWSYPTSRILTGDGSGQFAPWRTGLGSGQKIRFGDISGDGLPDLVFGNANGTYALLGAANPASAFTQQITVSTSLPFYLGSIADFELGNLDDDPELEIIAIVDSPGYRLFSVNRSGSSFEVTPMTVPGSWPGSLARGIQIADFDGDGANDLVLRREGEFALYLRRPTDGVPPALTLVSGSLTFVRVDEIGATEFTDYWTVTNADVTGTPSSDLLFATESQLWIATAVEPTAGTWLWQPVQHIVYGLRWVVTGGPVVAGDFDGDGLPDLAYVATGSVYVSLQR